MKLLEFKKGKVTTASHLLPKRSSNIKTIFRISKETSRGSKDFRVWGTRTTGGGETTGKGILTTAPLTSFPCPDHTVVWLKRKKREKKNLLLTKPAATRPAWWLLSAAKNRPWSGPLRRRCRLERAGLARWTELWHEPASQRNCCSLVPTVEASNPSAEHGEQLHTDTPMYGKRFPVTRD